MNRIHEELNVRCVKAPASIATATATKSDYVDAAGADEIEFYWSMASLASGKTMTVKIYGASDANGTDAAKIAEGSVTAGSSAIAGATACASVRVPGNGPRYYCAEITHDSGSGVVCSCIAISRPYYCPDVEANLIVSA